MKSPNLGGDSPKLIKAATLRTLFENNPLYHFTLLPIEAILARKLRYLKTKYFLGKKQMWHFLVIFVYCVSSFPSSKSKEEAFYGQWRKKIIDGKDFEQPNGISSALLPYPSFLACLISWAEGEKLVPLFVLFIKPKDLSFLEML